MCLEIKIMLNTCIARIIIDYIIIIISVKYSLDFILVRSYSIQRNIQSVCVCLTSLIYISCTYMTVWESHSSCWLMHDDFNRSPELTSECICFCLLYLKYKLNESIWWWINKLALHVLTDNTSTKLTKSSKCCLIQIPINSVRIHETAVAYGTCPIWVV